MGREMDKLNNVNLENAYFHGLTGEIPYYYQTDVLMISLQRLRKIIELKGLFSRKILQEKGIDYSLKPKIYNEDDYISICSRRSEINADDSGLIDSETGQSFDEYIRNRISIAISSEIDKKCQFREGFERILGEKQVKDTIDISDFLAIVIDLKSKKDIEKAIIEIKKFTSDLNIPITDIDGNVLENIEIVEELNNDNYER